MLAVTRRIPIIGLPRRATERVVVGILHFKQPLGNLLFKIEIASVEKCCLVSFRQFNIDNKSFKAFTSELETKIELRLYENDDN